MNSIPSSPTRFSELGLAPKLLEILEKARFSSPTPIQEQAIPVALQGEDVIGIAQTGTGKTLAFSLPMIQQISRTKGMGLVVVPTRELALQVDETLEKIGLPIGLRRAVLIGGAAMNRQLDSLKKKPHIIVATPGRLIDHLRTNKALLNNVQVLVLDEADRMLDMGFEPQIREVLANVPRERQTLLFSATMPSEIVTIAARYMKKPTRIEIARAGTAAETVTQEAYIVGKEDKIRLLDFLLSLPHKNALVFSRTKHGARKIARAIREMGHTSAELHANRTLGQRRAALDSFKRGEVRVLVATDIAARGIDVSGIELVINYDLPDNPDDYIHRIGRTGRAGKSGAAISFITPDQTRDVKAIERLMRKTIPVQPVPSLPPHRAFSPASFTDSDDRHEQRGRGRGRGDRFRSMSTSKSRDSFKSSLEGRHPSRRDDRSPRGGSGRSSGGSGRKIRVHF